MKPKFLAVATIAGLLSVSCSGASKTPAGHFSASRSTSTVASRASAASSAESSSPAAIAVDPTSELIAVTELPTGWAIDNSSSDASEGGCLSQLKPSFASEKNANRSFTFNSNVPELVQAIGTYSTSSAGHAGYGRGTSVLANCSTISFTSDGQTFKGSVGQMSFPPVGDESSAWTIKLSASGLILGIDMVLFRKGAQIEEVALLDLGSPSTADLTTFTQQALAKLT
jgi:hypothetical protein